MCRCDTWGRVLVVALAVLGLCHLRGLLQPKTIPWFSWHTCKDTCASLFYREHLWCKLSHYHWKHKETGQWCWKVQKPFADQLILMCVHSKHQDQWQLCPCGFISAWVQPCLFKDSVSGPADVLQDMQTLPWTCISAVLTAWDCTHPELWEEEGKVTHTLVLLTFSRDF